MQDVIGAFEKEVRHGVALAAMMLQSKDLIRAAGQAATLGLQEDLQQETFKCVCCLAECSWMGGVMTGGSSPYIAACTPLVSCPGP